MRSHLSALITRHWPALLLFAMLGLLLGVGAYTFHFADGSAYLYNDPKACASCHVMRDQYDSWLKASHHAVATCNDCHVPHDLIGKYLAKGSNGYHHSAAFTLQNFKEPIRIKPGNAAMLEANCINCHRETVSSITAHGGLSEEGGLQGCVRCHREVGHGPER